jgi:hypothetical protein
MTKATKSTSRKNLFDQNVIFGPDDLLERIMQTFVFGVPPEGIENVFMEELASHPKCINEILHRWFLENAPPKARHLTNGK